MIMNEIMREHITMFIIININVLNITNYFILLIFVKFGIL